MEKLLLREPQVVTYEATELQELMAQAINLSIMDVNSPG
jgi:hypothetical protein